MTPEKNKRLFLNRIGLFEIIPNPGEGDCLFHTISQALNHFYNQSISPLKYPKSNLKPCKSYPKPFSPLQIRQEVVTYLTGSHEGSKLWNELRPELLSFWKYYNPNAPNTTSWIDFEETQANTCCCFKKHRKNRDAFKKFYTHRMSQVGEPGTVYELRAAANLYGFHFDYLDTISPETSSNASKPLVDTEKILLQSESQSHVDSSMKGDNADEDGQVVICRRKFFHFYSCRNNACKVPRDNLVAIKPKNKKKLLKTSCVTCDRRNATTTTTPSTTYSDDITNDYNPTEEAYAGVIKIKHFYLLHTRYSNLEGHWELIRPTYLRQFPVPLHQKMLGVVYTRPLVIAEKDSLKRVDSIAEEIETQIRSGEMEIPSEDPDWPADDGDDFVGCLQGYNKSVNKFSGVKECNHSKKVTLKKGKVSTGFMGFGKFFKMLNRKNKVAHG